MFRVSVLKKNVYYVYCLNARVRRCNKEICRILPTMKIHIPVHRVLYGTIIECLWIK